jgi:hypothetical protein
MTTAADTNLNAQQNKKDTSLKEPPPPLLPPLPPPHKIPPTSDKPSFTHSDKYFPVDKRFRDGIRFATEHTHDVLTKAISEAVINHWGDLLFVGLNNHYDQLAQIELAYKEQDTAESNLNIKLEKYKTNLSELAPHGIISTNNLQDMIELLRQDCDGKTLLLSLIFHVSQDTMNKTDWSLTDMFPMTLLVSVKNFFEQKSDSNEEGTTDYGKYKMYMFCVLFLRY